MLVAGCRRQTIDTSQIATQLRNLLQLSTAEYIYRQIGYLGEEKSFLFFKTMDKRLLYSVNIHVLAGVDLRDELGISVEPKDPRRVTVTLPSARVLQVDADESTLHQYFARSFGGTVSWLEYGDQIAALESATKKDAIERGILDRADANARRIVGAFLTSAGFSSVDFVSVASNGATGGESVR